MKFVDEFPRDVTEGENLWIPTPDDVKLAACLCLRDDTDGHPAPAVLEYIRLS